MTAITKDFRLNAQKRKSLVSHYEDHLRNKRTRVRMAYDEARENFVELQPKIWELITKIVRKHQPQQDVDTINSMIDKYGDSGGRVQDDACFNFTCPTEEKDSEGKTRIVDNDLHLDMKLDANVNNSYNNNFAYAYYYDDLKLHGLDPDFEYRWGNEKRNPRYYETENQVREFIGFSRNKNDDDINKPINDPFWKHTIPVIGTSYCHSRQFQVDDITHSTLNQFRIAQEELVRTHEAMFDYINEKVTKIEQGLKSYTKYSQAKELFDKLGIPLNEAMLNDQSTMALSVFSPDNLADMLTDKDDEFESREAKIAHFKALQSASIN
jgi:hypothetical protein